VSESNNAKKHTLLCLRLAAECRTLAAEAPEPDLRALYLRMASEWMEIAVQPRAPH
jgi:hypothetical protein